MDLQAYINAHPWLAATVTTTAAWLAPTPKRCAQLGAVALSLVKGAVIMSLNPDQIREAIHEAQKLVKLGLEFAPGGTPAEKAKAIEDKVDPIFQEAIAPLGLPGAVNSFATQVFNWMIEAEVKAAEAA